MLLKTVTVLGLLAFAALALSVTGFYKKAKVSPPRSALKRFEPSLAMMAKGRPKSKPQPLDAMTLSPSNTAIWVKLSGEFGEKYCDVECDPKTTKITKLKKLVKLEFSLLLGSVDAPMLEIKGANGSVINEDVLLVSRPEGRKMSDPFLVQVPKSVPQIGKTDSNAILIPGVREFTVRACDFIGVEQEASACSWDRLVDAQAGVTEALENTRNLAGRSCSSAGEARISPTVFSSLARGGKTTFLLLLFDRLKQEGFAPIFINFNGNFARRSDESQRHAILRLIAGQIIAANEEEMAHIYVTDEEAILAHLRDTCGGKPLVLLIDELNMLADGDVPDLDADASALLKTEFLDKAGRYLVFTTHVPMFLDNIKQPASAFMSKRPSSNRYVMPVPLPFCIDIHRLRNMSESCASMTGAEVAIFSGIPSFIFSSKTFGERTPLERFRMQKIAISEDREHQVLQNFISQLIDGVVKGDDQYFDMFGRMPALGMMQWPICYIAAILDLFPIGKSLNILELVDTNLKVYASKAETGLDWELIIQLSIFIRCIDAMVNGSSGPFGVADPKTYPEIDVLYLAPDIKTIDAADELINERSRTYGRSTLLVVTPTYAKFPVFDGIVAYIRKDDGVVNIRKIGYQAKLGADYPNSEVPSGFETGILLRGKAPTASGTRDKWEFYGKEEIKKFVGFSMSHLVPSEWPTG